MNLYNVILDCKDKEDTFFWSCEVTSDKEQNIQSLLNESEELCNLEYIVDEIELLERNSSLLVPKILEFSGKAYYEK